MSNPSKKKGTQFEVDIVTWLDMVLPVTVERRAQRGKKDTGDISGIPDVVCELKNQRAMEVGSWVREAEDEADRDGGSLPVVIHKRKGHASPATQFVTMPAWVFVDLLKAWLLADAPVHPKSAETAAEIERLAEKYEAERDGVGGMV